MIYFAQCAGKGAKKAPAFALFKVKEELFCWCQGLWSVDDNAGHRGGGGAICPGELSEESNSLLSGAFCAMICNGSCCCHWRGLLGKTFLHRQVDLGVRGWVLVRGIISLIRYYNAQYKRLIALRTNYFWRKCLACMQQNSSGKIAWRVIKNIKMKDGRFGRNEKMCNFASVKRQNMA